MRFALWAMAALFAATQVQAEDDGQALFNRKCATCHQRNGQGIEHAYPALANNGFLVGAEDNQVISVVFKGRDGMPAWGPFLKDDELAKILTYARTSWGNAASPITAEQVAALRKTMTGFVQSPVGN